MKIFIGVDQTGAIGKNKIPKPLPVCWLKGHQVFFDYLPALHSQHLYRIVDFQKADSLAVAIDCVLGLPESLGKKWRKVMLETRQMDSYGMTPARVFFKTVGGGSVPRRRVEVSCGANSVFKEKPYQKNIQTGTYRLWKDIAQDDKAFAVPFLGEKQRAGAIPIYEGYPSLSWRLVLEEKNRAPEKLSKLLAKKFPRLHWSREHQSRVEKDVNLADAFVLALHLKMLWPLKNQAPVSGEGWILGHEFKGNKL